MLRDGTYGNFFLSKVIEKVSNLEEQTPKFKETDQSLTSSTTFTEITDLSYTLGAYEKIAFTYTLYFVSESTDDIKFTLTCPPNSTIKYAPINGMTAARAFSAPNVATANSVSFVYGAPGYGTGSDVAGMAVITGVVEATGTSGNLIPYFAQQVSGASETKVLKDSYLLISKASRDE